MNPLCVVATTDSLSSLGRKNIENIKSLGVDMVEYSLNPKVRRVMNRIGLEQIGDISWPEHVAIFTVPIRVAVQFNIKLVVWGENSQNEYGGPAASQDSKVLDRQWLEEFGGLLGLRVTDLIGQRGIKPRDLFLIRTPRMRNSNGLGFRGFFWVTISRGMGWEMQY